MKSDDEKVKSTPAELQAIAQTVRALAASYQGEAIDLLRLLRVLEALHQEIRDELFQQALPMNRQALYALLRTIETEGGWPYIPRMNLKAFLKDLPLETPFNEVNKL